MSFKLLDSLLTLRQIHEHLIPKLKSDLHKGQSGKIGVVGGSQEYCGAPYYAAMSAIRTGADLGYVVCTQGAMVPIKCYGPELIVLPFLYTKREMKGREEEVEEDMDAMMGWIERLDALVIGPGLGRDEKIQDYVCKILSFSRENEIPTVIDADALWTVNTHIDLVEGNRNAILTPNVVEYGRLWKELFDVDVDPSEEGVSQLASRLGNVTVVLKGASDIITDGNFCIICTDKGGLKRAGGQGDVLGGILGTFSGWVGQSKKKDNQSELTFIHAAYAATKIAKAASKSAFDLHGRALSGLDLIPQVGPSFEKIFPELD